jgi:hypothetical protein
MSALKSLESNLEDVFVKKAPALPSGGKKALVEYLPWINLILGLLSLYTAYVLWNWAHVANRFADYANSISAIYGGSPVVTTRLTTMIWVGLAVLVLEALLYIAAFPALRARKKSGWNLLFYAMLVNVVYGVVMLFADYGGVGTLIGSLIGSAVGLYLLFQIRGSYSGAATRSA